MRSTERKRKTTNRQSDGERLVHSEVASTLAQRTPSASSFIAH
ncbi:hypothetical protein [Spirosoma pulveris]